MSRTPSGSGSGVLSNSIAGHGFGPEVRINCPLIGSGYMLPSHLVKNPMEWVARAFLTVPCLQDKDKGLSLP